MTWLQLDATELCMHAVATNIWAMAARSPILRLLSFYSLKTRLEACKSRIHIYIAVLVDVACICALAMV